LLAAEVGLAAQRAVEDPAAGVEPLPGEAAVVAIIAIIAALQIDARFDVEHLRVGVQVLRQLELARALDQLAHGDEPGGDVAEPLGARIALPGELEERGGAAGQPQEDLLMGGGVLSPAAGAQERRQEDDRQAVAVVHDQGVQAEYAVEDEQLWPGAQDLPVQPVAARDGAQETVVDGLVPLVAPDLDSIPELAHRAGRKYVFQDGYELEPLAADEVAAGDKLAGQLEGGDEVALLMVQHEGDRRHALSCARSPGAGKSCAFIQDCARGRKNEPSLSPGSAQCEGVAAFFSSAAFLASAAFFSSSAFFSSAFFLSSSRFVSRSAASPRCSRNDIFSPRRKTGAPRGCQRTGRRKVATWKETTQKRSSQRNMPLCAPMEVRARRRNRQPTRRASTQRKMWIQVTASR